MTDDLDRAPYGVDLNKRRATYYVIADDEGVYNGDSWHSDRTPTRNVLEVQRAADHDVERALQCEDLTQACRDSQSPLEFLAYEAVSCGDAARRARREFTLRRDFDAVIHDITLVDAGPTD